jgi:ferrous iron transport protein A
VPLTLSGKGTPCAIKRIGGPDETKKRLETMGFTVGSEVTVMSDMAGSLIVIVKDSRIALNRELANHIFVSV